MAINTEIQIEVGESAEGQQVGQRGSDLAGYKILSHHFRLSEHTDGQVCQSLTIKELFLGACSISSPSTNTQLHEHP